MKASKLQELVLELKVGDVMTREIITVHPQDSMSELREILCAQRISGLPVVDGSGLVGIISVEDFIEFLAGRQADCAVEQKMTKEVETLWEDESLSSAVSRFEASGLGRFPVIRRGDHRLVGIVTKGDVIEGLLKKLESDYHQEETHVYRASHVFEDIEADSTTLVFEYAVSGKDFKRAGEVSSRLKRSLGRLGIRPDIVRRVAIASYEAEMNLAIFTDGGTLRVRVQPSQVLVQVEDSGPGIADVGMALQPGYSTAPDWVRELGFGAGMGLPNIQNMSDEFELESREGEGTTLRLSFAVDEGEHETD